jgi:hypothetical protein
MSRKPYLGSTSTKLTCDSNGQFTLNVISDTVARRHKIQDTLKLQRNEVWGIVENWETVKRV